MRVLQAPESTIGRPVWAAVGALLLMLAGCATPKEAEAPDVTELVWPLPPEQPRIRFVRSVSAAGDIGAADQLSVADVLLGKKQERGQSLLKPYGVHADKDGRIFVADTGWGKVLVFDIENKKFDVWGDQGRGLLGKPIGITSDSLGRIYVTDAAQQRVVVFDAQGKFLLAMGKKGELERPAGIALNEDLGRIYVADTKKHNIAVFDMMSGTLVSTIGERGKAPGQFNFPTNMAMDSAHRLYVVDTMNFRIQILDAEGQVIKTFGEAGDGMGQFARPKGIAVDSDGHVYVSDAAFNNFQIFDREGQLLLFVGTMGREPGEFWLPAGAYIDAQDRIYVVDQFNFRVQVFQYLGGQDRAAAAAEAETAAEPEAAQ